MDIQLIVVAIPAIIGGLLNVLLPEWCITISRRFIAVLRIEKYMCDLFFSVMWCRFVGALVLIFGLVVLAIGLFSRP